MHFLSIQSWVTYGHVGNSAAIFPLQRTGHEVSAIHTVQFSNHLGYGPPHGRIFDAPMVDEIIDGLDERGMLPQIDCTLSGYLGSVDLGQSVLSAVARVRRRNAKAIYCCDPVLGDVGSGIYVRAGLPEFFAGHAIPAADIITPNHFEFEWLSGTTVRSAGDVRAAAARLHERGPQVVLVTSFIGDSTPADSIDVLAIDRENAYCVRTPKFDRSFSGCGDITAALFAAHWLASGRDTAFALFHTVSSVYGLLRHTVDLGRRELAIVAAQSQFIAPDTIFTPHPLS